MSHRVISNSHPLITERGQSTRNGLDLFLAALKYTMTHTACNQCHQHNYMCMCAQAVEPGGTGGHMPPQN